MEFRQLKAFVAVAEDRSFTRAVARLHVAQSGLTAAIRSLGRGLEATLSSRTTRRVELTAAGEVLLDEARHALGSAHAAVETVRTVEGVRRRTSVLGIMQATSLFDLPRLLARYRSAHPEIELRLQQASALELGRLLAERRVDVIFRAASNGRALRPCRSGDRLSSWSLVLTCRSSAMPASTCAPCPIVRFGRVG